MNRWVCAVVLGLGMAWGVVAQDRVRATGAAEVRPGVVEARPAVPAERPGVVRAEGTVVSPPMRAEPARPDPARPVPPDGGVAPLGPYLETVERFMMVAMDPVQAGIAAVLRAGEILRAQGPKEGLEYFRKLLPKVQNPAVMRAIRIQMIELYQAAGQTDEALSELGKLILEAPEDAFMTEPGFPDDGDLPEPGEGGVIPPGWRPMPMPGVEPGAAPGNIGRPMRPQG
jgi:hypothetical protein